MNSDTKFRENQDQQQQQPQCSNKNNHRSTELTAEWTVHAQLTISRPDNEATPDNRQNPVRVVYKWSSDNVKPSNSEEQSRYTDGSHSTAKDHHDSFHSTATTTNEKLPSDSGLSSSNASRKPYSARCKSTCSIVLSAVADFMPPSSEAPEEPDPFYFNTTSTYNVLPDQTLDETTNVSQNFGTPKILSLRDAFCQTSDTESTRLLSHTRKSSAGSRDGSSHRKIYDYRRQTESLLPPPVVDEGDTLLPSFAKNSTQQAYYPSSSNRQSPGSALPSNISGSRRNSRGGGAAGSGGVLSDKFDTNAKKAPRTVHIDVYCTGSDAEDDEYCEDEIDEASSQSSSDNPNEIESNSTPQTVLNTEQMRLRHQRAGKNELPRRFTFQSQQHQQQMYNLPHQNQQSKEQPADVYDSGSPVLPHLGHTLSHSNTAEEISESKQILFKKHIGDQKSKMNFRNRYFRRDQSDDAISSSYPNSSRSTMRDMTCSSISSAIASTSAIYEDLDTSWKETEPEPEIATVTSVGKSDSFEYDSSVDRVRIKHMERFWSEPDAGNPNDTSIPQNSQQRRIQDFLQSYHGPPPRSYHDALTADHEHNTFGADHRPFVGNRTTIPERDEPDEPSDAYCAPQTHRMTLKPGFMHEQPASGSSERPGRLLYQTEYIKSGSETSTLQSNLSGYTTEYLQKARRFGAVVTALRKPGHHVGPSKNPDCQCEHCRRWMAERVVGRSRAYSIGDSPLSPSHYWLRRSTPGI